jgi:hypothetical protein
MSRFQSLVIVSHGRSGSKLLQGILNTAPGFLIRGENKSFLDGFQLAHRRLDRARNNPFTAESSSLTHAFYGIQEVDLADFLAGLAIITRNVLVPPGRRETVACYGYKEIRFPVDDPEFTDYMDFLRKVMPNLAIILNTRAHEGIAGSGWWSKRPTDKVIQSLADADAVRLNYVARNPDHTFHIRYEDVCAQGDRLRELFDFLGATFLPEPIAEMLATPHGRRRQDRDQDVPD